MSSIDSWFLHAHPCIATLQYNVFSIPTCLCIVIPRCTISPILFPKPPLLASLPHFYWWNSATQISSPMWNPLWPPDPNESLLLFSHDDYYSYGILGTWDARPCAMRKVLKQILLSLMSLRPMITDGEPWIFSPLLLLVFRATPFPRLIEHASRRVLTISIVMARMNQYLSTWKAGHLHHLKYPNNKSDTGTLILPISQLKKLQLKS